MPLVRSLNYPYWEKVKNPFYHGTDPENLQSILKQGLLGGLSIQSRLGYGGTFITKSLKKAETMGETILEINLPSGWKLEYDESELDFESPKSIPPRYIKRIR